MLLQRLSDYADHLDLPPALYSSMAVRYVIVLSPAQPEQAHLLDTRDRTNPAAKNGRRRMMPSVTRSAGIKPLLFADNASYTFGILREGDKPERVAQAHRAYLDVVRHAWQATQEPAVQVILHFLEHDPLAMLPQLQHEDFDPRAAITFRVKDQYVTELPRIQEFWARLNTPSAESGAVVIMQCLVCGQRRPVLERLQGTIKGIMGGQTSGTALISANAPAFESYGLNASHIAPTCAVCAERFTKSLNMLLQDQRHRMYLGGLTFVFWLKNPDIELDLMNLMQTPEVDAVRALLASAYTAKNHSALDETPFYAVSLSASGARVTVRDWMESTLGTIRSRLATWFSRQEMIAASAKDEAHFYGLTAIAGATVRDLRDLPVTTPQLLLQAALFGTSLPTSFLQRVLQRCRAEQQVTRVHAVCIKLVLSQHVSLQEDSMSGLNPNHPEAAYHCGRLLAVLEEIQRRAIRGIKATIRDRFYSSASSAPASVFPTLMRGAQPHLSKIQRDTHSYTFYQEQLAQILGQMDAFPQVLDLPKQGLFALGYYHQRAQNRQRRPESTDQQTDE